MSDGIPPFPVVVDGVIRLEERSVGPEAVDEVQRERLVADLHRADGGPDPGRDLVADGQLGQRPGEPGLQVAAVVDEVPAREGVHRAS